MASRRGRVRTASSFSGWPRASPVSRSWSRRAGSPAEVTSTSRAPGALLSAALFWAIGSLYARRAKLPSSTLLATSMEMLTGGAALLLTSGLVREWRGFSFAEVSTRSWLALGYLIVAGSLVGFTAYIFLLGATTPARVGTYAYVNPIVAVFFGWAFASEIVTARMVIAALAILGAVAVIIRYGGNGRRKKSRERRPRNPFRSPGARGGAHDRSDLEGTHAIGGRRELHEVHREDRARRLQGDAGKSRRGHPARRRAPRPAPRSSSCSPSGKTSTRSAASRGRTPRRRTTIRRMIDYLLGKEPHVTHYELASRVGPLWELAEEKATVRFAAEGDE